MSLRTFHALQLLDSINHEFVEALFVESLQLGKDVRRPPTSVSTSDALQLCYRCDYVANLARSRVNQHISPHVKSPNPQVAELPGASRCPRTVSVSLWRSLASAMISVWEFTRRGQTIVASAMMPMRSNSHRVRLLTRSSRLSWTTDDASRPSHRLQTHAEKMPR